jgi:hypothetical protein
MDAATQCVDITSDEAVVCVARLYDANNTEIDESYLLSNQFTFKWGWKENKNTPNTVNWPKASSDLKVNAYKDGQGIEEKNKVELTWTKDNDSLLNTWNILECTLTGWGDHSLTAYLPIPLRRPRDKVIPLFSEGASRIVYTTLGEPEYYRRSYRLYHENESGKGWLDDLSWKIYTSFDTTNATRYWPQIITNNATKDGLKALNFYLDDTNDGVIV